MNYKHNLENLTNITEGSYHKKLYKYYSEAYNRGSEMSPPMLVGVC